MRFDAPPPLGLAHFTVLEVLPPALVDLAATRWLLEAHRRTGHQ